MTFAVITPALIVGAFPERVSFRFLVLFTALWLLLVYVPVAHWVWGRRLARGGRHARFRRRDRRAHHRGRVGAGREHADRRAPRLSACACAAAQPRHDDGRRRHAVGRVVRLQWWQCARRRCVGGLGDLRLDGQHRTSPVVFRQRPEDYLEQFHSTSSLARELMPPAEAARFGAAVLAAVRDHERDGLLDLPVTTDLTWAAPAPEPGATSPPECSLVIHAVITRLLTPQATPGSVTICARHSAAWRPRSR